MQGNPTHLTVAEEIYCESQPQEIREIWMRYCRVHDRERASYIEGYENGRTEGYDRGFRAAVVLAENGKLLG